jgi:hypothetical protein
MKEGRVGTENEGNYSEMVGGLYSFYNGRQVLLR